MHDEAFGDGGVRRVHHIATLPDDHGVPDNALIKQEIQTGSLAPYMLIPIGGNPYASDLVTDYWSAVRSLVKSTVADGSTLKPRTEFFRYVGGCTTKHVPASSGNSAPDFTPCNSTISRLMCNPRPIPLGSHRRGPGRSARRS